MNIGLAGAMVIKIQLTVARLARDAVTILRDFGVIFMPHISAGGHRPRRSADAACVVGYLF